MSTYQVAVSVPVNTTTLVSPGEEMPAQILTFGLSSCTKLVGLSCRRWSFYVILVALCTSSENMMSRSVSPLSVLSLHHCTLFSWLFSDVIAPYLVFVAAQPSSIHYLFSVLTLTSSDECFSFNITCSLVAVSSSSVAINSSMNRCLSFSFFAGLTVWYNGYWSGHTILLDQ